LLPTEGTPLRSALDQWFDERGLRPHILGEFDDGALMGMFARDGLGFVPLHSVAVDDAATTFRVVEIGNAPECRCRLHAITAERRLKHPAILAVTAHAQEAVFGTRVAASAPQAKVGVHEDSSYSPPLETD
jgi:LysR family transcriptional activator of nhaA